MFNMIKQCEDCCYSDNCNLSNIYIDTFLLGIEESDCINDYIEERRIEFRKEWFKYIENNEN